MASPIPGIDYYVPWSDHFPRSSPPILSGFRLPYSRYRNIPWAEPSIEFGDIGIPSADQFPTSPTGTDTPTRRRRRFPLENSSTSNKRARVDDDDAVFRLKLPEVAAASGADCAICLQDLDPGSGSEPAPEEATPRAMPCSHAFHERCIFKWLRQNPVCPICRRPLHRQQHQYVEDEDPLQLLTPLPQEEDFDDEDPPQWWPMPVPRLQLPTPVPREQYVDDDDQLQLTMPVPREMLEIEVL